VLVLVGPVVQGFSSVVVVVVSLPGMVVTADELLSVLPLVGALWLVLLPALPVELCAPVVTAERSCVRLSGTRVGTGSSVSLTGF
jgi:hypothetical protein